MSGPNLAETKHFWTFIRRSLSHSSGSSYRGPGNADACTDLSANPRMVQNLRLLDLLDHIPLDHVDGGHDFAHVIALDEADSYSKGNIE